MFHFNVIRALTTRYILLYAKNPVRAFELFFWPLVQLLVWGFLTKYLQTQGAATTSTFPKEITFLIGGIVLWDALFRAQQGVSISFLEDIWTRNLLNIFAAPVKMTDYVAATFVVGTLRVLVTGIMLWLISIFAYSFNLLSLNWGLIAYYGNLLLFGWALGIISIALILRWGHGAESLAWALPFMVQPIACVFYPVSALPGNIQWLALIFPPAHVFEGMRNSIKTGYFDAPHFWAALGLNALYLTASGLLLLYVLRLARDRGLLVKATAS